MPEGSRGPSSDAVAAVPYWIPVLVDSVAVGATLLTAINLVTRPILLVSCSQNQRSPSGPEVIPFGVLVAEGIGSSVMTPSVVIRPILLAPASRSANQRAPSEPATMPHG